MCANRFIVIVLMGCLSFPIPTFFFLPLFGCPIHCSTFSFLSHCVDARVLHLTLSIMSLFLAHFQPQRDSCIVSNHNALYRHSLSNKHDEQKIHCYSNVCVFETEYSIIKNEYECYSPNDDGRMGAKWMDFWGNCFEGVCVCQKWAIILFVDVVLSSHWCIFRIYEYFIIFMQFNPDIWAFKLMMQKMHTNMLSNW